VVLELPAHRGVLVKVRNNETVLPIIGFFAEDDTEIIFKNAAEKTVCLARLNCPELLKKPQDSNHLVSITIRISLSDKQILEFMALSAATGSRHNSASAVIEKFIVQQFIKKIRVLAAEAEDDEK
jgi:hypothetical protein